ncbi:hypothetical protein [Cellulomonas alba]|uniref:Uncharacterized protein n=1 Tax=Cellulomonas alba TaxID=3053467 RepID=A0ABT7SE42_9CELL|nr:hypothetical protein [Cellulomonas alba]MDM7854455.1 hypothetical protein [Cellulomonas alba]
MRGVWDAAGSRDGRAGRHAPAAGAGSPGTTVTRGGRAGVAVAAVLVLAATSACAGARGSSGGAFPDLPSAYHRWCGRAIDELIPHWAPELLPGRGAPTLTIDAPADLPADAPWRLRTTLDVPVAPSGTDSRTSTADGDGTGSTAGPGDTPGGGTSSPVPGPAPDPLTAIVYGTDVSLLRDGRVVAVRAGRAAPTVAEATSPENRGDYAAVALPFSEDVEGRFVACDGHTLGGAYDLVVTDTIALEPWATSDVGVAVPTGGTPTEPAPDAWPTDGQALVTVVGASVPVQVATGPGGSPRPLGTATAEPAPAPTGTDPAACGAPVAGLRALAAAPAPIAVDLTTRALPDARRGEPYSFGQRLTNDGTTHLDELTGHPLVLVTRDGRVVGGPGEASDAIGLGVQLDPGTSTQSPGLAASTLLRACVPDQAATVGDPLPPGTYDVWTVWTFTPAAIGPPMRVPETPAAHAAAEGAGTSRGSTGAGTVAGSSGASSSSGGGSSGGASDLPRGTAPGSVDPTGPDAPVSSPASFVAVGGPWPLTIG